MEKIIQTTDGGANWAVMTSPVLVTLHSIWFSSIPLDGLLVMMRHSKINRWR
ncbi:MAG: hypothetical protein IPM77_11505 [Crocinitomicaceae bacterium]|nr:hypothetical protein [Crocinitomicaceae bacterium]